MFENIDGYDWSFVESQLQILAAAKIPAYVLDGVVYTTSEGYSLLAK